MQSKNKKPPTDAESDHIERVKNMSCVVCGHASPSDAHEIKQGLWWTSIPLCKDCHQGSFNGIHGQQRIWKVRKMDELMALNETVRRLMT